jgi:hypothetical protein
VTVSPIPNGATLVAANDVLATEFGEEVVLLHLQDGVYYGLEDVGTRIWQLLQQPVSVLAIREALVAEFDVDSARCERDIRRLLTDLVARGLVEIRDEA